MKPNPCPAPCTQPFEPNTSDSWRPEIPGWSTDILPFYARIAQECRDGECIVEVGVAMGRSLTFMAQELVRLGKLTVQLWGIDPWLAGWKPDWYQSAMSQFVKAPPEELEMMRLVRAPSRRASKMFLDQSVDCCFIDALHEYEYVREDIEAWRPKITRGGLLCGHDYGQGHTGVKVAVDEAFGGRVTVEGTVWQVRL